MPPVAVLTTLREIRLARGWSLQHLSAESGIPKPVVSQIERGRMVATQQELDAIADALELDSLENRTVPCTEHQAGAA